jgi:hypothetical protein
MNPFERLAVYLYKKNLKDLKSKPLEVHARDGARSDYILCLLWGGSMAVWFVSIFFALYQLARWGLFNAI